MPLPSLHPLPVNPTTGQQPLASLSSRGLSVPPPASAAGGGGVNRETLNGLREVIWSDDEDDPDCLLCAEPLDLSDLNFRPCHCGMQICQFCYNKLLSSDARCPGCRRAYDAKAVVYQPVDIEEVKRAKEKKTRRAKVIKQLSNMGRRHLLGVRVVMKNMVHVMGMKLPAERDEAIPILRTHEYFGQYGKISKLYLRDRSGLSIPSVSTLLLDEPSTPTSIYIVYVRREDAARAISALDGIPAPQGAVGSTLKATYGTTRYCDAFLRGMKCDNASCTNLHEWGGESDCFTKDDMETALTRPQEYDARQKQSQQPLPFLTIKSTWPKAATEDAIGASALPNSAGWGKTITRILPTRTTSNGGGNARPTKIGNLIPLNTKSNNAFPLLTPSPVTALTVRTDKDKKKQATAMARDRSTDSTQSATTGSSRQTSPKKRQSRVLSAVSANAITSAIGPPPGLSPGLFSDGRGLEFSSDLIGEEPFESISANSEAGPSSSSPAPQTPARYSDAPPPPPLTSEPIRIHSPYEEPELLSFAGSDPGFAYVLGLDDPEIQRQQALASSYVPSAYSKALIGLAELGIASPELPDFFNASPHYGHFTGSFQPFDSSLDGETSFASDATPGPSRSKLVKAEVEPRRTTSKFEFARPSSRSTGRGPSPFAPIRTRMDEHLSGQSTWSGRLPGPEDAVRHPGADLRSFNLSQHVSPFPGGYSNGNDPLWAGDSVYMPSPASSRVDGRRADGPPGFVTKAGRVDREGSESGLLPFSNIPSFHGSSLHDEVAFHSAQLWSNSQQRPTHRHSSNTASSDSRSLQQFGQGFLPPGPSSNEGLGRTPMRTRW